MWHKEKARQTRVQIPVLPHGTLGNWHKDALNLYLSSPPLLFLWCLGPHKDHKLYIFYLSKLQQVQVQTVLTDKGFIIRFKFGAKAPFSVDGVTFLVTFNDREILSCQFHNS